MCEPLCCLFPERLQISLPGGITFSINLNEIKETLIDMTRNGTLYDWKEQERKAAISARINTGIARAGAPYMDKATKDTIVSKTISATNLKMQYLMKPIYKAQLRKWPIHVCLRMLY